MDQHFHPLDYFANVDKYHLHLPHWRQRDVTYFVTWRLADSLPKSRLDQLRAEQEAWLRTHQIRSKDEVKTLPEHLRWEYQQMFTARVHEWLDSGMGSCALREPGCSAIVVDALRYFDGERYALDAFVVMPNHVHVLVRPLTGWKLEKVLHSWKSFTAKTINQATGKQGVLWLEESWDHIVRSLAQLEHFRLYIRENPVKARLSQGEFVLGCGGGLKTDAV